MGINDRRQTDMEHKRAERKLADHSDAQWRGYINVTLNDVEKAEYDDWVVLPTIWEQLGDVVMAGCVVTVKWVGAQGHFMASITQRNPESVNAGLCVTARSVDCGKALWRAVFLVLHLGLHSDWAAGRNVADPDRW